jgi:hypothetical protein
MSKGNILFVATVAIFLCYQATCGDLGNFNPYLRGQSHPVEKHDGIQTHCSANCGREVVLRGENAASLSTVHQSCLNAGLMKLSPSCTWNHLSLRGGSGSRTSSTRKSTQVNPKAAASSDRVVYGSQKAKVASKHRSRPQEPEISSSEQSEESNSGSSASRSDNSEEDVVRDRRSKSGSSRRSRLEVILEFVLPSHFGTVFS